METIAFLERIIGGQKTLIITCMECCLDIEQRLASGNVFRYTALGNMVDPADENQIQSILTFIDFKGCSKIIVIGHDDCRALNYILRRIDTDLHTTHCRAKLAMILNDNHGHLLPGVVKDRVLVEQNVIAQCQALLEHRSIKKHFEERTLTVTGLVIRPSGRCRQVFSNGISFNNIISMN
jgi:carbonic anhydrase